MDTETEPTGGPALEIPAKAPKVKKPKPKAKKPAVKKKPAKKAKAAKKKPAVKKKPAKSKPKAKKASKPAKGRTERLDLRLGRKEKAKLHARAKATRRTVTSIIVELIEKMK